MEVKFMCLLITGHNLRKTASVPQFDLVDVINIIQCRLCFASHVLSMDPSVLLLRAFLIYLGIANPSPEGSLLYVCNDMTLYTIACLAKNR